MRRMKIQRGEGGFTLIELAVVMALVAIMALFVAPAIGEWLDNFHIRQAGREMSSDLQFAKMKAISTGSNCSVVFNQDVGGTVYAYVIFPDYNNDLELNPGIETNDIFKMGKMHIISMYHHPGDILFLLGSICKKQLNSQPQYIDYRNN